jgi:hypothetical protein
MTRLYTPSGIPEANWTAYSSEVRNEFAAIATAFETLTADIESLKAAASFAAIYQGASTSAPAVRKNGTALQNGDLYFNPAARSMMVWSGVSWSPIPTDLIAPLTKTEMDAAINTENITMATAALAASLQAGLDRTAEIEQLTQARILGDFLPSTIVTDSGNFVPGFDAAPGVSTQSATGVYYRMGPVMFIAANLQFAGDFPTALVPAKISLPLVPPFCETPLYGGVTSPASYNTPWIAPASLNLLGHAWPYIDTAGAVRFRARSSSQPGSSHYECTVANLAHDFVVGGNARVIFSGCYLTAY